MYCFGVDLGGTAVKMGLFSTTGDLIRKMEFPVHKAAGAAGILGEIADTAVRMMAEQQIKIVHSLGICIPGPVEGGRRAIRCVNLGWNDVPVAEMLEHILKIPVAVANDANTAALGENWQGAGRCHDRTVFVTLGTGVGGGLVENGGVLEGSNGCGGEIGHMTLFPDETIQCGCGKYGCLEQYTAAAGIVRQAREKLTKTEAPSVLREVQNLQAKDIFDAAKAGDALALQVVQRICFCLGVAFSSISAIFDPEAYIIGGGISKAGTILIDTTIPFYRQYAFPGTEGAAFHLASLGNDAGIYGAARISLNL